MLFSRAEAALIASRGMATSISFLRRLTGWRAWQGCGLAENWVGRHSLSSVLSFLLAVVLLVGFEALQLHTPVAAEM
jgi:hypothetical protein